MRYFILSVSILVGMASSARAAESNRQLVLTAAEIKTGGIESAPLQPVRRAATVIAYGQVLDPGLLAAASASMASARAAVDQAQAKLALAQEQESRAATLFRAQHNISEQDFQIAEAGARVATANLAVAQAKLRSAQAQVGADWGKKLGAAIVTGGAPLPELANATSCLVEVTLPLGAALTSAPAEAKGGLPTGNTVLLHLIGPSPRTPAGSGQSLFYLGRGAACPPSGTTLQTGLAAGPQRVGVVVPAAAVVWWNGEPLAFRDDGQGGFALVSLADAVSFPDGYFVPAATDSPFEAGQKVVVKGGALLLSQAEMSANPKAAGGGDDD